MRIAICEDRADDLALLRKYIEDHFARMGYAGEILSFDTGEALLSDFAPDAFDVIFMDIYLPNFSGMETARLIRKADPDCLLFFVTTSTDHALEGFELRATNYLVKPINEEKIDNALYACRDAMARKGRVIEFPVGQDSILTLPAAHILYVEVYKHHSRFHLHGLVHDVRISLDDVEQTLGGAPFFRCHRSYLINMNHVDKISEKDFLMKNGDTVPMRVNGRNEVKTAIANFMAGRSAREVMS
jgi:DNA-binding LytR/AlgR family response regulator